MPKYIRSGATGLNDGSSWANAWTSITKLMATTGAVTTDWVLVANDHVETITGDLCFAWKGNDYNGILNLIGVNVNTGTPTGYALTNSITVTGKLVFRGIQYHRSINFIANQFEVNDTTAPTGGGNVGGNNAMMFDGCKFTITGSAAPGFLWTGNISLSGTARTKCAWLRNTPIAFNNPAQGISLVSASLLWQNTPNAVQNYGGGVPAVLFPTVTNTNHSNVVMEGVDLSGLGANSLVGYNNVIRYFDMKDCKLHASTTLRSSNPAYGSTEFRMTNSDSSSTNYREELARLGGVLSSETSVKVLAPRRATNGTVSYSHRISTDTNTSFGLPFYTDDYIITNTATQSPVTLSMSVLADGYGLTNEDIWIEVEYVGAEGPYKSSFVSSRKPPIGAATVYPNEYSATWTAPGLSSPMPKQISVTFEPKYPQPIRVRVYVARKSATIYLHPRPTIV